LYFSFFFSFSFCRVPPAKRTSYNPLGVYCPHHLRWLDLVHEWRFNLNVLLEYDHGFKKEVNDKFFILRDTKILNDLNDVLKDRKPYPPTCFTEMKYFENALIPVKIEAFQQGTPEDKAILCLPTAQDFIDLKDSVKDEFSEYSGPVEPQHKGPKNQFPFIFKSNKDIYFHNVQLIGRATRWSIGFLQTGNYSFATGKGAGTGFVSVLGLYYHLQTIGKDQEKDLLIFRNTNTLQYRFCKVKIIVA